MFSHVSVRLSVHTPPPGLAIRRAVCLLRSRRRTFLLFCSFTMKIFRMSLKFNLPTVLTLRAPAVHSGPELLLPQATSVTILQNACATLVD